MKKTIIALFALGSIASAATVAVESTITGTKSDQGGFYGFTLAVGSGFSGLTDTPTIPTEITTLNLDSIEILTRDNQSFGDTKIALYEYTGDSTTGTYVGTSSTESFATNSTITFDFSNIEITKGTRYQFLFVNANATAEQLSTFDGYKEQSMTWGIATTANRYAGTTLPGGWGIYTNNTISGWSDHRMPVLTVNTSYAVPTSAVPEPATATLSLLALAGLAARRRRK